ncbi:MAG: 4-(cytidine 5'-diphospho)-2-C-methyl-D-erythritol kinase [Sphingosinicella sp.]|nr:4-(cytidine 5'-diphospho)-2-C-methyl-D-erythritol kinase [Sphingosinicella sp.]
MHETAYAKINLALHVRARELDGYHRIETLFAFAEDGDGLIVEECDSFTLNVDGAFAQDLGGERDNLVIRAALALQGAFNVRSGAGLTLDKKLPVASGIGGGSADAAAALRLLTRWWGLPATDADLIEIGRTLGADVAACVRSETCRGIGRGDHLVSQDGSGLAGMPLLLVNPGAAVATRHVFEGWDGVDRGELPIASPLATALGGRNDLELPALRFAPEIKQVLAALGGARRARMSGSGATCFALYEREEERDEASNALAALHPQWWRMATRLR